MVPNPNEAAGGASWAEESERIISVPREQNIPIVKRKGVCDCV